MITLLTSCACLVVCLLLNIYIAINIIYTGKFKVRSDPGAEGVCYSQSIIVRIYGINKIVGILGLCQCILMKFFR